MIIIFLGGGSSLPAIQDIDTYREREAKTKGRPGNFTSFHVPTDIWDQPHFSGCITFTATSGVDTYLCSHISAERQRQKDCEWERVCKSKSHHIIYKSLCAALSFIYLFVSIHY